MMKTHCMLMMLASLLTLVAGCSSRETTKAEHTIKYNTMSGKARSQDVKSESYVIRRGDEIELTIFGYPEFTLREKVKEEGTITIPLAGSITVLGLTKDQLTDRVRVRLTEYIRGEIKPTITITSSVEQKVAVIGAVARQDNYTIVNEIGLVEILAQAGGATTESDLHRVQINRRGGSDTPTIIDLAWYVEQGRVDELPMIYPGDTIIVPKKENVVRNFSEFFHDAILIFSFFRALY